MSTGYGTPWAMDRQKRGETCVIRQCEAQRRVLEVKIMMNPDDSIQGFAESRLLQFAGTLLHEMCHAAILLYFAECRSLSCLESILHLGIEGHGTIYDALFRSMVGLFVRSTGWTIGLEAHLYNSIFQDRRKLTEAVRLWIQISYHLPESARIYAGLTKLLILTQNESGRLIKLIEDGRDVLEIIIILKYKLWNGYWRLPPWDSPNRENSQEQLSPSQEHGQLLLEGLHWCIRNQRAWVDVVFITRMSCRVLPQCSRFADKRQALASLASPTIGLCYHKSRFRLHADSFFASTVAKTL